MKIGIIALTACGAIALSGVALAQTVPEQFVVSGKNAEKIKDYTTINLATAERIADSCEKAAAAENVQISIMVLDNDGNQVYMDRMDGQGYLNIVTADMKARTALMLRQPSKLLMNRVIEDPSLELQFNDHLRLYECPLQLKASAGVLLIDDFGRQQCSPQELLNRWIVPLERGIDFMTLMNGQKVAIPFAALVVFSTNLRPSDLVDEAFLRRVPNKVWVSDPSPEQYREILVRACRTMGVTFSDTGFLHLLRQHYQLARQPMRACHPRDLLRHIVALSRYYGVPAGLAPQLIDAACHMYFLGEETVRDGAAALHVPAPQGAAAPR